MTVARTVITVLIAAQEWRAPRLRNHSFWTIQNTVSSSQRFFCCWTLTALYRDTLSAAHVVACRNSNSESVHQALETWQKSYHRWHPCRHDQI